MLLCTNHRFGPIGQRLIGLILKQVLTFLSEGLQDFRPLSSYMFGRLYTALGRVHTTGPSDENGLTDRFHRFTAEAD